MSVAQEVSEFEAFSKLETNWCGTSHHGYQFSLQRDVRIIELSADLRAAAEASSDFWKSAIKIAQRNHPALAQVHHIDRVRSRIVLEYTHDHYGDRLGSAITPDEVAYVLKEGLAALQSLHDLGLVHGDVRPHTLLTDGAGRVKLDFPIESALAGRLAFEKRSMRYWAPESASGDRGDFGPQSDLYMLGFSVLELLLGRKFDRIEPKLEAGETDQRRAWMRWHASETSLDAATVIALIPDAPAKLIHVICGLLRKSLADRYRSASDAAADLAAQVASISEPSSKLAASSASGASHNSDLKLIYRPFRRLLPAAAPRAAKPNKAPQRLAGISLRVAKVPNVDSLRGGLKRRAKLMRNVAIAGSFFAAIAFVLGLEETPSLPPPVVERVVERMVEQPVEPPKPFAIGPIAKLSVKEGEGLQVELALAAGSPAKGKVAFSLVGTGPEGLELGSDGRIVWTPEEEQGPKTYTIAVMAADETEPPQKALSAVEIEVLEVNRAPELDVRSKSTTVATQLFKLSCSAEDPDEPEGTVRFRLGKDAPSGMYIDEVSGNIEWTPPATLKPIVHYVTVIAFDDGTPTLEDERSIRIEVTPENRPPVFAADWLTLVKSGPGSIRQIHATDPNPDQTVRFRFAKGSALPPGMALSPSGEIQWSPPCYTTGNKYTVEFEAYDSGSPEQVARVTQVFTVMPRSEPKSEDDDKASDYDKYKRDIETLEKLLREIESRNNRDKSASYRGENDLDFLRRVVQPAFRSSGNN